MTWWRSSANARTRAPSCASVSGLSVRKLTQMLQLLEEVGAVVTDADGKLVSPPGAPLPVEAARLALAEVERHKTVQRTRIDMMRQFAESRSCRSQALLAYFGERMDGACGHCDNCDEPASRVAIDVLKTVEPRTGPTIRPRERRAVCPAQRRPPRRLGGRHGLGL